MAIPQFDSSLFSNDSYVRRVKKPWGYELHWVPDSAPYLGKVIHIKEGARLSLQIHDEKSESWFLMNGRAAVIWENAEGALIKTELQAGVGYTTRVGQRHRLIGLTECDVIEVSTPESGTTYRLEDDYARPHETHAQRLRERQS